MSNLFKSQAINTSSSVANVYWLATLAMLINHVP